MKINVVAGLEEITAIVEDAIAPAICNYPWSKKDVVERVEETIDKIKRGESALEEYSYATPAYRFEVRNISYSETENLYRFKFDVSSNYIGDVLGLIKDVAKNIVGPTTYAIMGIVGMVTNSLNGIKDKAKSLIQQYTITAEKCKYRLINTTVENPIDGKLHEVRIIRRDDGFNNPETIHTSIMDTGYVEPKIVEMMFSIVENNIKETGEYNLTYDEIKDMLFNKNGNAKEK